MYPFYFCDNFLGHAPISVIFGSNRPMPETSSPWTVTLSWLRHAYSHSLYGGRFWPVK